MPSLVHWLVDHATWDALVTVIEGWWRGTSKNRSEIRFDYLRASPLDNGWRVAYGVPGQAARWLSPTGAPVPGSIFMEMDPGCAIEKVLEPTSTLYDRVAFSAKYTGTTMLFMRVGLATLDGSRAEEKWIKFEVGRKLPYRTPGYEEQEWTLQVGGKDSTKRVDAFRNLIARCGG